MQKETILFYPKKSSESLYVQKQQLVDYNNSIVNVKRETLLCARERETHRHTHTWKEKEVEKECEKKQTNWKANQAEPADSLSFSVHKATRDKWIFIFFISDTVAHIDTYMFTR